MVEGQSRNVSFLVQVYRLRERSAFTSPILFLKEAGVRSEQAEVYSPLLPEFETPDACKDLLRSLMGSLSPQEVFSPEVLQLWVEYLDDPEQLAWTACESVQLFELLDDLSDHANKWVRSQMQRPDKPSSLPFWKHFQTAEQKSENGDVFPQASELRRQLGFEFTPGSWYFHGTTAASAVAVVERGIQIGRSRMDQDFSINPAFYTNEDFADAKAWAIRKAREEFAAEAAVMVLFVPEEQSRSLRELDLNEDTVSWERLVCASRRSRARERRELLASLGNPNPDRISGAICANPQQVCRGHLPMPRAHHRQVAFCTEDAQDMLSNVPVCVVFFSREIVSESILPRFPEQHRLWHERARSVVVDTLTRR